MNKTELISRHIFLFPFKWETRSTKPEDETTFSDRSDLDKLEKVFFGGKVSAPTKDQDNISFRDSLWERTPFNLDQINTYNEFNYFYDFVREILYDLDLETSSLKLNRNGGSLLRHYEWIAPRNKNYFYEISIPNPENREEVWEYKLGLDSVNMNVYQTGVGVLSFFLSNRKESQSKPEDILRINQFGRRIYPPFFSIPGDRVGQGFEMGNEFQKQLNLTKGRELAGSITISGQSENGDSIAFREDFVGGDQSGAYANFKYFEKGPFRLPVFIEKLFPQAIIEGQTQEERSKICTQEALWEDDPQDQFDLLLKTILDDRMFVLCWYGGREQVERNRVIQERIPDYYEQLSTKEGRFWYQYIFVDGGGPSTENHRLATQQLKRHTYERWIPLTYYGLSRYSFVCLTSNYQTLEKFGARYLIQHMESIYYKVFELCIIQRASVLRFSDEVTHLSHFADLDKEKIDLYQELSDKIEDLYKNYIRFINKIYFREVTDQEQGIEIYDMFQDFMRIEPQVKDLDAEIEELHSYVKMLKEDITIEREKKNAETLNILALVGAFLVFPSFVLSLYGLKIYECFQIYLTQNPKIILILLLSFAGVGICSIQAARTQGSQRVAWSLGAGLILILMLIYPLFI
ncbi:MAG: hypothetical protein AAFQ92_17240 [Bacteroidota bacterium]